MSHLDVYIVGIGEETNTMTLKIAQAVRHAGFSADRDFMNRKPKAQFKTADKNNAKVVLTNGSSELENQEAKFKVMKTGKEITVSFNDIFNDFERIYNTQTADMTAFDDFFTKE